MQRQKCIYLNTGHIKFTTPGANYLGVLKELVRGKNEIGNMYTPAAMILVF